MQSMPRTYNRMASAPIRELFFAGLDLGQTSDFTALAILQRRPRMQADPPKWLPPYTLRYCERYALNTPYPAIVADVTAKCKRPEVNGMSLTVDQTGVGRPVVDMFRMSGNPLAVTITGGRVIKWEPEDNGWHVPKRELVAVLQLLFQNGRIRIPRNLPNADVLRKELMAFRVKVKLATGNETFEAWRERDHDDTVLAVALAAWAGERSLAIEKPVQNWG